MLRYEEEDIERGINIFDCVIPEDRARAKKNFYRLLNGESLACAQYTACRKDGTTLRVILESSCIIEGRKVAGLRGAVIDISQLKQTEHSLYESEMKREQERFKAEKLESIGIIAGGIANDFNNFLTGILGNVSLAKTLAHPSSEFFSILTDAERILLQASELTQQLLTFSKDGAPAIKPASINKKTQRDRSPYQSNRIKRIRK
jgi:signal transduction histidine kinase